MRLPDPARMFGLPAGLARPLSRRMQAVNTELDKVAARYGTLHWDAGRDPETYERRNWSVDRLHPNERGHRLIACLGLGLARRRRARRRRQARPRAVQPAADQAGRGRLDDHQGHRVAGPAVP